MRKDRSRRFRPSGCAIVLIAWALGATPARAQLGLAVGGVGPINRSMGGAAVAAPLDASGALYWNPATIAALGRSEIAFGSELLFPYTTLSSRVAPGTFGPAQTVPLSGTSRGNNGGFLLPAIALVYQPEECPFTFGFGIFAMGGFGTNYAASRTNPILTPQFPNGGGVGALYAQYQALQFSPTAALQITDRFSVGLQANIDMGTLSVSPALFTTPTALPNRNSPLGVGLNYPPATNGRARVGAGFQVGAYYALNSAWSFGAAIKSTQWFDTYTYNAVTVDGHPARPTFNFDFPMIASIGAGYTGIERLLVALDLRFLDYRDTNGFRRTGFNQAGALQGLGWQNVFALALGSQYQLTDFLSVRAGYTFSLDPASNAVTSYNIGSPTIVQHTLAVGASYDVSKALKLSVAYVHYFENAINGPIIAPGVGALPGSNVRATGAADSVLFGANVSF